MAASQSDRAPDRHRQEVRSRTVPVEQLPERLVQPHRFEMMLLPEGVWFGFTRTDDDTTDLIVTCGQDCAQRLLIEE